MNNNNHSHKRQTANQLVGYHNSCHSIIYTLEVKALLKHTESYLNLATFNASSTFLRIKDEYDVGLHVMIILSVNRLVVWSIKSQKMLKNVDFFSLKTKVTSSNVLLCLRYSAINLIVN